MIATRSAYLVTVTARDRGTLLDELDAAVDQAIEEAIRGRRQGVLVTRHDYRTYTVRLTEDVPYGLTLEADELAAAHA